MKILALETSTDSASCAFWRDGDCWMADCPAGQAHSETLLPLTRRLLDEAGCDFTALDAIAFDMGPGAFTSLRVACAVAQGLAVALDIPVLPVGSLEAMAWSSKAERVVSLLDARMGEVYFGAFERVAGGMTAVSDPLVAAPEALVFPEGEGWLAVGNALRAYPQLAVRLSGWLTHPERLPDARAVAELGALAFARGEVLDPADAVPRYLRNKVAYTTAERLMTGGRA